MILIAGAVAVAFIILSFSSALGRVGSASDGASLKAARTMLADTEPGGGLGTLLRSRAPHRRA